MSGEPIKVAGGPPHLAYVRLGGDSNMVLIVMGPDDGVTRAVCTAAGVAAWDALPPQQRPTDPSWDMPGSPVVCVIEKPSNGCSAQPQTSDRRHRLIAEAPQTLGAEELDEWDRRWIKWRNSGPEHSAGCECVCCIEGRLIATARTLGAEVATLKSEVRHLRSREASIIEACERVADGGQYLADIVSAIQRIRRERDDGRDAVARATRRIDTAASKSEREAAHHSDVQHVRYRDGQAHGLRAALRILQEELGAATPTREGGDR